MTLALHRRWHLSTFGSGTLYAMLAEAAVLLLVMRVLIRFCFPAVAPWALTARHPEQDKTPPAELELALGRSVQAAIRALRWRDCCLPAAMTVKAMLARRGYAATIHLGAGFTNCRELHAHAWIEAGGQIITGEQQLHTVTPLPRPVPAALHTTEDPRP